jgi:hypothetical protein
LEQKRLDLEERRFAFEKEKEEKNLKLENKKAGLTALSVAVPLAQAISSSRPKTSLPVTGNLATEIFLGPSLAGGLRVSAREAAGGILCKPSRVILRPAWIAPAILGIALRSSVAF